MSDQEFKQEFLSFINMLFYANYNESGFNSFIIDFTNNETKQYFFKTCISWIQSVYGVEITKEQIINLYIKYSQYNIFNENNENIIKKFVITKDIIENAIKEKLIPEVEYVMENDTVKKLDPKDYIKKKK